MAAASLGVVDLAARMRHRRLVLAALRVPRRVEERLALGALSGIAVGMLPALLLRTPAALVFGMTAAALCVLVAAAPLVRRSTRAAFELHVELALGGRALALDVGAPAPGSSAAANAWIREHGEAAAPIGLLIGSGRIDAARAAIDDVQDAIDAGAAERHTALWLDMHRQDLRLATGEPPSLDGLEERLRAVDDPRHAQVGLAWLAVLEAATAVAERRDPLPLLVAGRSRLQSVRPIAQAWVLVAGMLLLVTAAAALAASLALLALGAR